MSLDKLLIKVVNWHFSIAIVTQFKGYIVFEYLVLSQFIKLFSSLGYSRFFLLQIMV
jgi:hypothetical protein